MEEIDEIGNGRQARNLLRRDHYEPDASWRRGQAESVSVGLVPEAAGNSVGGDEDADLDRPSGEDVEEVADAGAVHRAVPILALDQEHPRKQEQSVLAGAISDGKVAMTYESADYGKVAVLSFPFGGRNLFAAYAHLSAIEVAAGQTVAKGQRIGKTGNTGNASGMTGPDQHLHFEIRTIPRPGTGLGNRMSPAEIFGLCPLHDAVDA